MESRKTSLQRYRRLLRRRRRMDHFTVLCLGAWPLNESEAGVVLIETFLLLLRKFLLICIRTASLA